MEIKPVKKTSLADDVVMQIKGMIVNQKIKVGDKLPNERELSARFNVSRSSVREALIALELQGLLNRKSSGTYVQAEFSNIIEEALRLEILLNSVKYKEIQVTRVMLERELVRLASVQRTEEQLSNIQSFIQQMENAVKKKSKEEFTKADIAFHEEVAKAAHNNVLLHLFNTISGLIFKVQKRVAYDENVLMASLEFHRLIYKALQNKEPQEAEEQMVTHLKDVEERLNRMNEMEKITLEEFNEVN